MAFTVDIRGNASHLQKVINSAKGSLASIGNVATAGAASIAAMGAAGAAGLGAIVISSSNAASGIESLTMQFKTLLGGTDEAKKRMEEIVKFAASTPFEIKELAATSKLLQTLGGDLLATGDGLRMVGDAAAISGQPLGEVGVHIGRLFAAMRDGQSAGEALARLQELGLISGAAKRQFEDLAKAQKKGEQANLTSAQALNVLQQALKKTNGAMDELSKTTEGKVSNMKDNFAQLQVAFGTGMNDGLRSALDAVNSFLPQLQERFTKAGKFFGAAISDAVKGDTEKFALIGAYIGTAIIEGAKAIYLKGIDEMLSAGRSAIALSVVSNEERQKRNEELIAQGKRPIYDIIGNDSASMSSYMQTAMENLKNSPAAMALSQSANTPQSPSSSWPKTPRGMIQYLKQISENTKMQSKAKFSN